MSNEEKKWNPHNSLIALDPPRSHPPRRWRCSYCGTEGLYDDVEAVECTYEYPPCEYCGQTPTCAPDCKGIALALSGKLTPEIELHVAGLDIPGEKDA
jgi:hypothetical protein